jgi:hypothetical protein
VNSSRCNKRRLQDICLCARELLLPVFRLPFRLSDDFHHPQRRVAPFSPSLPYHSRLLLSRGMPEITPSAPSAQPSTASINAQFLSAVTRGDDNYARSLLARGADVNATDATGRSAVACVLGGERCALRGCPGYICVEMLNT